ncbi:MAG: hypothetical protein AB7T49_04010 [Oligoflexales bacterium]
MRITLTVLLCILAIGCKPRDKSKIKNNSVNGDEVHELGTAYESLSNKFYAASCVDNAKYTYTYNSDGRLIYKQDLNVQEAANAFTGGAGVAFPMANGAISYAQQHAADDVSTTFTIFYTAIAGQKVLDNNIGFSQMYGEKNKASVNWRNTCGNEYVRVINYGVTFVATLKVTFENKSERKNFGSKFGFDFNGLGKLVGVGVDGGVGAGATDNMKGLKLEFDATQKGGNVAAMGKALGMTPDDKIACEAGALATCLGKMAAAVAYIQGDLKNQTGVMVYDEVEAGKFVGNYDENPDYNNNVDSGLEKINVPCAPQKKTKKKKTPGGTAPAPAPAALTAGDDSKCENKNGTTTATTTTPPPAAEQAEEDGGTTALAEDEEETGTDETNSEKGNNPIVTNPEKLEALGIVKYETQLYKQWGGKNEISYLDGGIPLIKEQKIRRVIDDLSTKYAEQQSYAADISDLMESGVSAPELSEMSPNIEANLRLIEETVEICLDNVELPNCIENTQEMLKDLKEVDAVKLASLQAPLPKVNYKGKWKKFEPNNMGFMWAEEDCGVVAANGEWNDQTCAQRMQFACKDSSGDWFIDITPDYYVKNGDACSGGKFAKPDSDADNAALAAAMASAKISQVWVRYNDSDFEGVWTEDDPLKL